MMLLRRLFPRLCRTSLARAVGWRRHRGAVMVEYAFLLVAVGVPAVAGLAAGGRSMFKSYKTARNAMLSPFP